MEKLYIGKKSVFRGAGEIVYSKEGREKHKKLKFPSTTVQ
jgi:hypothetical protein